MERVGLLAMLGATGYTISVVNRQLIVVFRDAGCMYKNTQRSESNRRQEENERRQRQVKERERVVTAKETEEQAAGQGDRGLPRPPDHVYMSMTGDG